MRSCSCPSPRRTPQHKGCVNERDNKPHRGEKKEKNSCHFSWNSNNDQLGATKPQVTHGAKKTRSKFFAAGLQTRCVRRFIFKQPPLQRSQVLCFLRGGRKEKDTSFSEIWHSQFLAFSFSSSRGYLTFSECSWAGWGRIRALSSGHSTPVEQEVSCRDESPTSCEFRARDPPGAAFLILCREQVLTTAMLID